MIGDNIKEGFALTASPTPKRTWILHVPGKELDHKEFNSPEEALEHYDLSSRRESNT